jgi:hypothetical protein
MLQIFAYNLTNIPISTEAWLGLEDVYNLRLDYLVNSFTDCVVKVLNLFNFIFFCFDLDNYLVNVYSSLLIKAPINSTGNGEKIKSNIHPSFSRILKDKTRGGVLLSKVIEHIFKQNKLNLPLFLKKRYKSFTRFN